MMSNKIHTNDAPAAIGPYSQAVTVGNLVFTSGQIPLDPATGEMVGKDITEQAHRVCKNLEAVLNASGSSLKNVVKTTCFAAVIVRNCSENRCRFMPYCTVTG